jgi:hypothetical protein
MAGDDPLCPAHRNRNVKAETADTAHQLTDLLGAVRPRVSRVDRNASTRRHTTASGPDAAFVF